MAFLGKIENARGGEKAVEKVEPVFTAKVSLDSVTAFNEQPLTGYVKSKSISTELPLDGPAIRRMIAFALSTPRPKLTAANSIPGTSSMLHKAYSQLIVLIAVDFDSVLDDYLPAAQRSAVKKSSISTVEPSKREKADSLDEFLGM